jgi:hypothetical protein
MSYYCIAGRHRWPTSLLECRTLAARTHVVSPFGRLLGRLPLEPAIQLSPERSLRGPAVAEWLPLDEDAGRKHNAASYRQLLALVRVQLDRRYRQLVLERKARRHRLRVFTESAVLLGQDQKLHTSHRR